MLRTPVIWEGLTCLRTKIERGPALAPPIIHHFQKLANATEKLFADRAILLDENSLLFQRNNEKTTRQSARSTIIGNAKIMTYEDIVRAEQKRAAKMGAAGAKRGGRRAQKLAEGKRSRVDVLKLSKPEIKAAGLEEYCSVLQF